MSYSLQVEKEILEDGVCKGAIHPKRFSIRGYADAERGSVHGPLSEPEPARFIRQCDPGHLRVLLEIHDGKAMEVGKLDKNTVCRSVRICLESHGAHGVIELQPPCDLIGLKINHCGRLALQRSANRIHAIRCDVDIMNAIDANAFDPDQ